MNIIRQVHEADKRARRRKPKSRLNLYPLLGIVLAIVLAVLTYGGLFAFLFSAAAWRNPGQQPAKISPLQQVDEGLRRLSRPSGRLLASSAQSQHPRRRLQELTEIRPTPPSQQCAALVP
jgi:hypothetical protein